MLIKQTPQNQLLKCADSVCAFTFLRGTRISFNCSSTIFTHTPCVNLPWVIFVSNIDIADYSSEFTHLKCHPFFKVALTLAARWTPTLIEPHFTPVTVPPPSLPLLFPPGLFLATVLTSQDRGGWCSSEWPSLPALLCLSALTATSVPLSYCLSQWPPNDI